MQVLARVEAVDLAVGQLTVTFPRSSTGGASAIPGGTPAPRSWQATLRVTSASLLQQVATTRVSLAAPVESTATTLKLVSGAPAVTARSGLLVVGLDECKLEVLQPATLAQSAAAGAGEWVLTGQLTKAFPAGAAVIVSEVKPIPLGEIKGGDLLSGIGGPFLFGLAFSGTAPNFVLTRLLRACQDDPCPRIQM